MLKRNVVVQVKIVLPAAEEKRIADFAMVLIVIDRRLDGQKNRSQKKKKQKTKNKTGAGYDQEKPFINNLILSLTTQYNRGLGNTQASVFFMNIFKLSACI